MVMTVVVVVLVQAVVEFVVVVVVEEEGLGVSFPLLHWPNPEHYLNACQTAYEY
jgi:hypothetical protein